LASEKKSILVCIDGSNLTDAVVEHAVFLAKQTQSELKFLHIIEHKGDTKTVLHEGAMTPNMSEKLLESLSEQGHENSKQLITEGRALLEKAHKTALESGITDVSVKHLHGQLAVALQEFEETFEYVVLGVTGQGHTASDKPALGTQLEEAIRVLDSPVYIVKKEFVKPTSLLLAYNGGRASRKALDTLKKGDLFENDLHIHIVAVQKDRQHAQILVNEAYQELTESHFEHISSDVLIGNNPKQLLRYQLENDIDITVMGAFSHGKLYGFLFGSFTNEMLLNSEANFLIIR
jgi:nucleotide-binding universal stress UspA family protein